MGYMSAKDAAEKWGISSRRVQTLCLEGRIPGAVRLGRQWSIPLDSHKPMLLRRKSNINAFTDISTQVLTSIELCAGAGGQALGLEWAGFHHEVLVEIDAAACMTLRRNRPNWQVWEGDLREFSAFGLDRIDLVAGGTPCPPFSVAGKQLGTEDERDLLPEALRIIRECNPKAVMLENVSGLFDPKFHSYREYVKQQLAFMGYSCYWELVHAQHFGVPQQRKRTVLVALKKKYAPYFAWPEVGTVPTKTVGETLRDEMASAGWNGATAWAERANDIAPTLVGGSKKHGGADLGPTRSKIAWEKLGVDGHGLANAPPPPEFEGLPRLTVRMAALLQGFPEDWVFEGKKTPAYRQVGNAFPPPVAAAIGKAIKTALVSWEYAHLGEAKLREKARRTSKIETVFS